VQLTDFPRIMPTSLLMLMILDRGRHGLGFSCEFHGSRAVGFDGAAAHSGTRPNKAAGIICVGFSFFYTYSGLLLLKSILTSRRGLDAIALVFVWLFVPGTERQIATMEEMNYVFGVSTRRHVQYQLTEVLPWYFNRYIRLQKLEDMKDLPPLYRYSRLRNTTAAAATVATGSPDRTGKAQSELSDG